MEKMLEEGVVSIVVPCYNVDQYLSRFFDCLLQQTYRRLQIILVDDGSTDRTHEMLVEYVPRLRRQGYDAEIVRQENQGLAAAIQTGLHSIRGEFFAWPDPDDILYPESIERRVAIFREQPDDVALVRCNAVCIREEDGCEIGHYLPPGSEVRRDVHFFRHLLLRRTFFGAMCCLVKTSKFLEVNPKREIYTRRDAGQNWQLMLPLGYRFRTVETSEVLCGYLIRQASHSRIQSSYEERVKYEDMCDTVVRETLARMGLAGSTWAKKAHALSLIHQYRIALRYGKDPEARLCLSELKGQGFSPRCVAWMYAFCAKLGKDRWNDNPESYLNRFLARVGVDCLPPY